MRCTICDKLDEDVIWENHEIVVKNLPGDAVFSLLILPKFHGSFDEKETSQLLWNVSKEIVLGCLSEKLCFGTHVESWESEEGHAGVRIIGRIPDDKLSYKYKKEKTIYIEEKHLAAVTRHQLSQPI